MPALGARAMTGCKGRGLVQEEQLRVPPRGHDGPMPPAELQDAGDPPPAREGAADALVAVVQAAAVAHQGAPRFDGDQLAERRDAILARIGGHSSARRCRRLFS